MSIRHLLLSSLLISSVDVNGLTDLVLLCLDLIYPILAAEQAVRAKRAAERARREAEEKRRKRNWQREAQKRRDREEEAELAEKQAATAARIHANVMALAPDDPHRVRYEARQAERAKKLAERAAAAAPAPAPAPAELLSDQDGDSGEEDAAATADASASRYEQLAMHHASKADPLHLAMLREDSD